MSHNVRITDNLWPLLAAEAGKRVTTPSRLVDLAVRRELGLEPPISTPAEQVRYCTEKGGEDEQDQ